MKIFKDKTEIKDLKIENEDYKKEIAQKDSSLEKMVMDSKTLNNFLTLKEEENKNLKKEFDKQKVDLKIMSIKLNKQCESFENDIKLKEDVIKFLT